MKWLDIVVRTVVFVIAFVGVFYIVPKIIIPDVIKMFKEVFKKQPEQRIEVVACYKGKKKIWDNGNTFDVKT